MIQLSGQPLQQSGIWPANSMESAIIKKMNDDPTVYSYQSINQLSFELELRKNILDSATAMNQSNAEFAVFERSRCNSQYWHLMNTGGFRLRNDVKPSDAIQDIYLNSSHYAFECATAMIIIYYQAVLNSIGPSLFNQLFPDIYLYSWNFDSDLGLKQIHTTHLIPGDVVYINNPDFNPQTPQWRGENAVVLEDGMYFGHGIGINTAEQMIATLNTGRKPDANQSAYLTNSVTRPSFNHLFKLSVQRSYLNKKYQHIIVQHNECSIPFDRYMFFLNMIYSNPGNGFYG